MSEETRKISVDFGRNAGVIKAVNGVNLGPISMSGYLDLSKYHAQLKIPQTRLHDCPYAVPETVDIHSIFPLFDADEMDPANYRFTITDDYIQSILDVGSDIVYRLGETIEHYKRRKYFIHPPKDYEKWARICIQIIRHYNEGWADGFHHNIRYWEIWNEPYLPGLNWTGTPDEYIRFYGITAKLIKTAFPNLMIGGPTTNAEDRFWDFGENFLTHCREVGAPVDFFSWHCYTPTHEHIAGWAERFRALVVEHGYQDTEMHLNEWHYVAPGPWDGKNHETTTSEIGAAFDVAWLTYMQDLPIDIGNFYWAKEGYWGLFDSYGVPRKNFYGFLAFARMLEMQTRVLSAGNLREHGRSVLAGLSTETATARILLANFKDEVAITELTLENLPWKDGARIEKAVVDKEHNLGVIKTEWLHSPNAVLKEVIPPSTVVLYTLTKK